MKVDLDASFDIIEGWKGIQVKSWKVNGMNGYITPTRLPDEVSTGVMLVHVHTKPCSTNIVKVFNQSIFHSYVSLISVCRSCLNLPE